MWVWLRQYPDVLVFFTQIAVENITCQIDPHFKRWHKIGYLSNMDENFSSRVKDVIGYSKEEALRLGHDAIGTEHLVLGLLREGEGSAIELLEEMNIDLLGLRQRIESLSALPESSSPLR